MQIVIDILEKDFIEIFINGLENNEKIINLIRKGTPLPKGHGRLVDADDITDFEGHYITTDAPTIIEADKESEE